MRILMLSWRGPQHPRAGGAEVYTEEILSGLVRRGHSVTWYSAGHGGERPAQWRGVRMVYGATGIRVYASGHRWLAHQRGYDVVVDQLNTFGFLAPRVARPVVALIYQLAEDVWDAQCWPGVSHTGRWLERRVLRAYRGTPFVTISRSTLADLVRVGWRGEGRIVPIGVEQPALVPKADQPVLCFLARLNCRAKRLDHAVEIFRRVQKELPAVQLWVIGRGAAPQGLLDHPGIRLFQGVDRATRDRLLGEAWCCLATSVREGWGLMVTEAAAAGTPAVAYDVPGLRESVQHQATGVVVAPRVDVAAQAVLSLLRDPPRRAAYGRAARQRAESFSWERSAVEFEGALAQACAAGCVQAS